MQKNIWDRYADWTEVAKLEATSDVQDKITGLKGKWTPNHVSPSLQVALSAIVAKGRGKGRTSHFTCMDFGCGLGRNAELLRSFFPRVVGFDLPEMIERLKAEQGVGLTGLYDAVYDELDVVSARENIHVLYDSVVFQHLVDVPYVTQLTERLMALPSLKTIVSLTNADIYPGMLRLLVDKYHWAVVLTENETLSFHGKPHRLTIFQGPPG